MATLHGEGAYDGLTAVLQLPGSVEEADAPPECFDIHGIVIESGAPPTPDPIDAEVVGLEPVPANATIGTAFQDDAFLPVEETDFAFAPGTWTIEFMNASDQDRGFVIEDPSGHVVAGGMDDLIAPGDMRSYELEITGSGEGYVMYDPTDREGTETAIPADGE